MGTVVAILLGIVFFGIGLSLTPKDFSRAFSYGWSFVYAASCQYIIFPLICFGICNLFQLSPLASVGIMLVSFSPSATTSNIYTFLFKGDAAFSVSLTAISTIVTPITISTLTEISADYFYGEAKAIDLPVAQTIFQMLLTSVGPLILGMIVRRLNLMFALSTKRAVNIISGIIIVFIVVGLVLQSRQYVVPSFKESGLAGAILVVIALLLGQVPRLFKVSERIQRAISFEICLQNSAFTILVALNILKMPELIMGIGPYSLLMFFGAFAWGYYLEKKRPMNRFRGLEAVNRKAAVA